MRATSAGVVELFRKECGFDSHRPHQTGFRQCPLMSMKRLFSGIFFCYIVRRNTA
jgi:hypothetical protein